LSAVLNELLVGKGAVEHLTVHACVTVPLVRDGFEEGCATRPRLSQDENHLAWLAETLKIVQQGCLDALLPKTEPSCDGRDDVEEVNECVGEGFDVVGLPAHAPDRQAIPVHPDVLRPNARLPLGIQVTAQ